jgi:predicted alpha/beta hydrolase family esterase
MNNRVFIIHGYEGQPEDAWRPWLRDELQKQNWTTTLPAMPSPNHPKMTEWVTELQQKIGEPTENTFIVGHSLGCIAILRYLETLGKNQKIGGTVLVAGFTNNLNTPELKSFFNKPIEWEKIKSHCKRFVTIHSDNDPWIPLSHANTFKEKLNAEIIVRPGMKHFSQNDNVEESFKLPAARDALIKMTKTKGRIPSA